jgi:hypothetical protein
VLLTACSLLALLLALQWVYTVRIAQRVPGTMLNSTALQLPAVALLLLLAISTVGGARPAADRDAGKNSTADCEPPIAWRVLLVRQCLRLPAVGFAQLNRVWSASTIALPQLNHKKKNHQ